MVKNQRLRTRALSSMIVTIVATLIALGCIIAFWASFGTGFESGRLVDQMKLVKDAFVYPFTKDGELITLRFDTTTVLPLILSIGVLVIAALLLAAIVSGVILAIKRKKVKFIWTAILFAAVAFVSAVIVMAPSGIPENGNMYVSHMLLKFRNETDLVWPCVLSVLVLVFGAVAFITAFVTFFAGLKYAKYPYLQEEGELIEEAEPALAEEALNEEIIEEVIEEEVEDLGSTDDQIPEVEPEPEEILPEVEEEPTVEDVEDKRVEVTVNNNQPNGLDTNSLATMLREVVRDIVRDEIARNNLNQPQPQQQQPQPQTITGATFGGPLVVQYFNGGINGVTPGEVPAKKVAPAPAPAPVAAPAPAPVVEEPAPVVEEPAPVVEEPAPVVEEPKEQKVYERISFTERLLAADKALQEQYNEIKNEILSWGVKSRVSASGDSFRLHKKMYVKLTVAGKSLKLYFALDPADYENSTIPVQDASNKAAYQDTPLVFKVKSALSVKRCKELIQAAMEKDGLTQGEVLKVNWIKELKAELKAGKKPAKEEADEE